MKIVKRLWEEEKEGGGIGGGNRRGRRIGRCCGGPGRGYEDRKRAK